MHGRGGEEEVPAPPHPGPFPSLLLSQTFDRCRRWPHQRWRSGHGGAGRSRNNCSSRCTEALICRITPDGRWVELLWAGCCSPLTFGKAAPPWHQSHIASQAAAAGKGTGNAIAQPSCSSPTTRNQNRRWGRGPEWTSRAAANPSQGGGGEGEGGGAEEDEERRRLTTQHRARRGET